MNLSIDGIKLNEGHCKRCGVRLHQWHNSDYCNRCNFIVKQEKDVKDKEEFLELRQCLDLNERLREIESWIYDHQIDHPNKELRMK